MKNQSVLSHGGRLVAAGMSIGIVFFAVANAAQAGDVSNYIAKGESAYASMYTNSPDGCQYSYLDLSGYDSTSKAGPGAPQASGPVGYVSFGLYDWCLGQFKWGYGELVLSGPLGINAAKLDAATIAGSGTVTIDDGNGTSYSESVTVNVKVTGVGDLMRGMTAWSYSSGTFHFRERSNGASRNAVAAGTIVGSGMNATFDGSNAYGYLSSGTQHNFTIIK